MKFTVNRVLLGTAVGARISCVNQVLLRKNMILSDLKNFQTSSPNMWIITIKVNYVFMLLYT